jgi:hypothetical protein
MSQRVGIWQYPRLDFAKLTGEQYASKKPQIVGLQVNIHGLIICIIGHPFNLRRTEKL